VVNTPFEQHLKRSPIIKDASGASTIGTWLLAFVPVLAGMLAVYLHAMATRRLAWHAQDLLLEAVIATCALCLVLSPLRYPEAARPARFLLVGLSIAVGLYGLALGTVFGTETVVETVEEGLGVGWYLLLLMTPLAYFRPSFSMFPFLYVAVHKHLTRSLSGANELGVNDYLPLIEIGLFIGASVLALDLMTRLLRQTTLAAGRDRTLETHSATLILVVAVGAHLGNYFMSGMAKVLLDGGPLSWALENPTSSLMLAGYNLGTAPLSLWPELFTKVYLIFQAVEVPLNVVTLLAQLLCFAAFFHKKALIGFALFFDIMHISIFLLTGALFLPWIILNSLIVGALVRNQIRLNTLIMGVGVVATVMGHLVFYNARLGWYDSRQIRHAYFVAVTNEDKEIPVPSNFFRDSSYLMQARHFGYRENRGPSDHIPTSAWGQIGIRAAAAPDWLGMSYYDLMKLSNTCEYEVSGPTAEADFDTTRPERFIIAQHQRALRLEQSADAVSYNLYAHHHFSLPGRFSEFEALDLDEIVAYRYIVETVCMSVAEGSVERQVMTRMAGPRINVSE
jgi:hypothetical protein